ncbi:MAG TPA: mobile mystery protein B [Acidimicrobiales bacterium]|nr:mobile mystery protein B [Acidimicrobiales bacterium]
MDDDAMRGLKPAWIRTRGDLNGAEQQNILNVVATRHPPTIEELLTDGYLRGLHRAMFSDVWTWAGTYRRTNPNIGCDWHQITVNVRSLLDDVKYWIEQSTCAADEVAVRFHHRLVFIHPFPNGNGRHSRLAANYLVTALKAGPLTWGSELNLPTSELRNIYIGALRLADSESDFSALVTFAKN